MVLVALALWMQSGQAEKLNWNPPAVYVIRGHQGPHKYAVRFEQANFRLRGRKVLWHQVYAGMYVPAIRDTKKIRVFWGQDGLSSADLEDIKQYLRRHTELVNLVITVDGRRWPIPKSLYNDLLDPNLGQMSGSDDTFEHASISKDGRKLTVSMMGSDGAGGYEVQWILLSNGKHTRTAHGLG